MDSVDQLLQAARDETGLSDFGTEHFLEGLRILVGDINTHAKLNAIGELALPGLIGKLLRNRLQIEDWYHRHPEIDDEQIVRPLVGLGLPRTGSTALAALLGEDPNARSLRVWEAGTPCPPPSTVAPPDPRIAEATAQWEMQQELAPRLAALVPATPTGPEECQDLMALTFKSHYFQAFAHIPTYAEWLVDTDLTSTYEYERRTLKLLQWGQPARPWRLKCPTHLLFIEAFSSVFPDARFVMTHRDPADVLVSVADVYEVVQSMFGDEVDRPYLGKLNVDQWSLAMKRAIAFRDAGNDERFYDLDFRDMQRAPIGSVARLYDWLGEPVSDEFEAGMRAWLKQHSESREENIHPDPAAYGLDREEIAAEFADYSSRWPQWVAATRVARSRKGAT